MWRFLLESGAVQGAREGRNPGRREAQRGPVSFIHRPAPFRRNTWLTRPVQTLFSEALRTDSSELGVWAPPQSSFTFYFTVHGNPARGPRGATRESRSRPVSCPALQSPGPCPSAVPGPVAPGGLGTTGSDGTAAGQS